MENETNPFVDANPFIEDNDYAEAKNYSDFISRQIRDIEPGPAGAIKLDCGDKRIEAARMTLRYVGNKTSQRFKTKCSNGSLWVMAY